MKEVLKGTYAAALIVIVGVVLLIALGNPSGAEYQACLVLQSQDTCTYYLK